MDRPLQVPHLRATADLELRPWSLSAADLELVREASADDLIPIGTVSATFSDEDATRFVERQWRRAADGTGYPMVIVRRQDNRSVGSIGLWLRDVDEGRASLGYWVVRSARGHGVAAHALAGLATWALEELHIPRLQLYVEPWNRASIRTAERAGFECEGLLRSWQRVGDRRRDMFMYARLATGPRAEADRARTGGTSMSTSEGARL
ncbi:GNAT family N-acetyltransferase [Nocardia testacea]|uniref:GNAT family N-acetyltransferase n=1 Tax=Nocardia testacea TaxID=248551 RepID=UPI0002D81130|nr:GNAT family N-acetyltransferase [Nocardia testacea]